MSKAIRTLLVLSVPAVSLAVGGALVGGLRLVRANRYAIDSYIALDLVGSTLARNVTSAFLVIVPVALLIWALLRFQFRPTFLYLGGCLVTVLPVLLILGYGHEWPIAVDTPDGMLIPRMLVLRRGLIVWMVLMGIGILTASIWFGRPNRSSGSVETSGRKAWWIRIVAMTNGVLLLVWPWVSVSARWVRPRPSADATNVIVVAWDSVRSDFVSAYGYPRATTPHLDAFARQSVLFENVVSQYNWTRPSFASILTSQIGGRLADSERNLAIRYERFSAPEIFKSAGYHTIGIMQNPNLDARFGFDQGFDEFVHIVTTDVPDRVSSVAVGLLTKAIRKNRPVFAFIHYQEPHWPYRSLPTSPERDQVLSDAEIKKLMSQGAELESAEPATMQKLEMLKRGYEGDIRSTDEEMGRLLEFLEKNELLDDSLVVFVSDHGDEFFEHEGFGHGHLNLHPEVTFVPLIIRFPPGGGVRPGRVSGLVRNLDILPTMLEVAGIEPPESLEGETLLPLERLASERRLAFSQWDESVFSVRDDRYTAYRELGESDGSVYFDRLQDRFEQYPIDVDSSTEPFHTLESAGLAWFESNFLGQGSESQDRDAEMDEDLQEQLRALGYLD